MALKAERVDTWAAGMKDKPGALAAKLKGLADAGVNLEFMIARREAKKKGTSVVFVTPISGAARCRAARKLGFDRTKSLHTVRITGADKRGEGAIITAALAAKGINLRGFSAAAIGRKFVAHLAVDSAKDAAAAVRALKAL